MTRLRIGRDYVEQLCGYLLRWYGHKQNPLFSVGLKTTYLVFSWKFFVKSMLKYIYIKKKVRKIEILKNNT